MNPPQPNNVQQPPEKKNGFFLSFFNSNKPQLSSIRIGIWGTVSAGKTIYLVRLYEHLLKSGNWLVKGDEKAVDFVKDNSKNMNNEKKDGTLPQPTLYQPGQAENKIDIFTYTLQHRNKFGQIPIILEFIDASGEFFENPDSTVEVSNGPETYKDIIDYLMSCHGIIFLLDPMRTIGQADKEREDYYSLLLNLFEQFQLRSNPTLGLKPLEQYMTFCVTKVDETDELWNTKDSRDLVKEVMGANMWEYLINNYSQVNTKIDAARREEPRQDNRCNFYATSAFGRCKNPQTGTSEKIIETPFVAHPDHNIPDIPETNTPVTSSVDPHDNETWVWDDDIPRENNPFPNNNPPSNNPPQPVFGGGLDDMGKEFSEEIPPPPQTIVKKGKTCSPINILEPVEWLIKSILNNPPILPQRQHQ